MKITYGSTVLVPGGLEGVVGLRISGKALTDSATFFRAIAGSFFARLNKTTSVEFDAWWYFNDRTSAESFIITHWPSLPGSGVLTLQAGDGVAGAVNYALSTAVLDNVTVAEWKGTAVRMHYSFSGGIAA